MGRAPAHGRDAYDVMNELAASSPVGANKLMFNPSLAGGSSQEPSPHIRGGFSGIDLRHTRGDLVRAGMEGIALNLAAVLEVLRRFVPLSPEMLMVGGGSKSALWRQIFADVYQHGLREDQRRPGGGLTRGGRGGRGRGRALEGFEKIDEVHRWRAWQKPDPAQRGDVPQAHAGVRDGAQAPGGAGRPAARHRHLKEDRA